MRRVLSVLLILCLAVGMLCIPAVAADGEAFVYDKDDTGITANGNALLGTVTYNPAVGTTPANYSVTFTDASLKNGGFYVLLSVNATVSNNNYEHDAISEDSIQYIDQVIAGGTAENGSISFENFIPKSLGKDQVLLLGGSFNGKNSPVALGVILSQGVEVSGFIQSYKPNVETKIEFFPAGTYAANKNNIVNFAGAPEAEGSVVSDSTSIFLTTQKFVVSGVGEGKYDVRISKAEHLDYWITDYEVGGSDCTMNASEKPYLLRCGDVERTYTKGSIIITDLSVIIASENYGKSAANADNVKADLDGNGFIDITDLSIVIASENYNATTMVEKYSK